MAVSINDFDKAVVYGLTNINDPTTHKPILVDSQGRVILAGGGTGGATVVEGIPGGVPVPVDLAGFTLVGSESMITNLTTAVTLTPPATATKLLLQPSFQNIRYWLSGAVPTATSGLYIQPGDPFYIPLTAGMTVKIIEESAGAATAVVWGK